MASFDDQTVAFRKASETFQWPSHSWMAHVLNEPMVYRRQPVLFFTIIPVLIVVFFLSFYIIDFFFNFTL